MKALDAEFAAHIAGGETTLCTCWRLRRRDGVVLGFTDHDCALEFDGTRFAPTHGLEGGEVPQRLGAQVETGEVLGILADAAITEQDILLGRYDGAEVESWRVNWSNPGQRVLLRRDAIGEIVREDGVFRAELRSAQQGLNRTHGRIYGSLCDAQLGDRRCRVALGPEWTGYGTVLAVEDAHRVRVAGLEEFAEGWFAFGAVRWSEGKRMGLRDGVVAHRRTGTGDVLTLSVPIGDWVEVGDTLSVTAGCDRRFATCREKFGNAVNFRGFPHIPGHDYVLRHPRNGDVLDGRAVVR